MDESTPFPSADPIVPPVLVFEMDDLGAYLSVAEAEQAMEPPLVEGGGFVAYDAEGRLLRLGVQRTASRGLGIFSMSRMRTVIDAQEPEPGHAEELRARLLDYLAPLRVPQSLSNSELVQVAVREARRPTGLSKYFSPRNPPRRPR